MTKQIAQERIQAYGQAIRDWYINQHNAHKCAIAHRLEHSACKVTQEYPELQDEFLKECWSTIGLKPAI